MKQGKQTCKILKEIRKQIAETNDIEFITSECQYQGDCLGTCPKCEAEVRYLEQQLERKRIAGKTIAILGISAGVMAMAPLTSCTNATSKATTQEVVNDTVVPVSETTMQVEMSPMESKETPIKKDSGIRIHMGFVEPTITKQIISEKDTFDMVEQMPQFPGGMKGLMEFINNTKKYSRAMKKGNCKGSSSYNLLLIKMVISLIRGLYAEYIQFLIKKH